MTSAVDGWALAWTSNPSTNQNPALVLARTTDGARDWAEVTLPGLGALPQGQVVLDAVSGQQAWLAVGSGNNAPSSGTTTVYGTADGGQQWSAGTPFAGSQPAALDFTGAADGWLLENLGQAMSQEEATLWRTTNGGADWSLAAKTPPLTQPSAAGASLPAACDKSGLAFSSALVGWITAFCNSLPDAVLVSRDGGAHWASQQLPLAASACQSDGCDVQPPQFAGPVTFLQIDAYPSAAYLLTSNDSGGSWTVLRLPAGAGAYPRSQFFGPDAGIAIAAGPQGSVGPDAYLTANGGVSWTAVPLGRSFPSSASFAFVSTATGFAWVPNVASPAMYQTTDSGRAWAAFTPVLAGGSQS